MFCARNATEAEVSALLKALPKNSVLLYPSGHEYLDDPVIAGLVDVEWLKGPRGKCHAEPLGTVLIGDGQLRTGNKFPAYKLEVVSRLGGKSVREIYGPNGFEATKKKNKELEEEMEKLKGMGKNVARNGDKLEYWMIQLRVRKEEEERKSTELKAEIERLKEEMRTLKEENGTLRVEKEKGDNDAFEVERASMRKELRYMIEKNRVLEESRSADRIKWERREGVIDCLKKENHRVKLSTARGPHPQQHPSASLHNNGGHNYYPASSNYSTPQPTYQPRNPSHSSYHDYIDVPQPHCRY